MKLTLLSLAIGILGASVVVGMAEVIQHAGVNPFEEQEVGRLPLRGTVQSPFGSSPQAVSPASPLQSLSQEITDG